MLEDDFTYVIRKALAGLELAPAQAAERAGIDGTAVLNLLAGRWNESAARALAPVLELDAAALAGHPVYVPPDASHPAITRLDLPFGGEQVNAWLIDAGGGKLLIDTGCDETSLEEALIRHGRIEEICHVIITHEHCDHTGGLGLFDPQNVAVSGPGGGHAWREMKPGDVLECGNLRVHARDLSGHAIPALGLAISGLEVPVLAMGDALFAGSIGGCPGREKHRLAKHNLSATLRPMNPQTLLLPGHGPATRLEAEWRCNPFLAALHGI